ncbi:wall associated protein [Pseudoxanthomonas sp. UTMC 1351]|uniref:wall associated protein n=1 Tax=Pseudoxanthomonas sp. UTMC 1351 TaxID=2695853 RepID=UPI0034CF1814
MLTSITAMAQDGRYTWEEFGNRVKASGKVQPLGPELFGDQVSLSNGALSFSATDVSIPGNGSLPVAFSRSFSVSNRKDYRNDATLADWSLEVPHISGVFASDWLGSTAGNPGKRCSVTTTNAARPPTPGYEFVVEDIWQGNNLSIPGVGGGEMLLTDAATTKPAVGGPYYWYVGGHIHVACLAEIRNGTGEGFIATTPDGTRYWFDWMAQYWEPPLKAFGGTVAQRRKNVLYATRVEDRFGNRVDYTYTNAWNAPARLTGITATDGRAITVQYNSSGHVSSVSDGSRTWQYHYGDAGDGQRTLTAVVLPDTSRWSIDLAALSRAVIRYPLGTAAEPARSCFFNAAPLAPLEYAGTITHPSGAVGEFTVSIQTHGRSSVPVSCSNFTTGLPPTGNDMNDDVNQWTGFYEAFSLKSKKVTGPGLPITQWTYGYTANQSFYFYPGSSAGNPVCPAGTDCSLPPCTSESCARSSQTLVTGPGGDWTRYYYGNTYRYNEGKLVKTENGTGASTVLRTTANTYDLSQAAAAYPARYGTSAREKGDGFAAEYHRPHVASTMTEQGTTLTRSINSFDSFARPLSVTRQSPWHTRTDVTAYHDHLAKWVLGQTLSVTNLNTTPNVVLSRAEHDPATALPLRYYGPGTTGTSGKLVQTLTYNADGTVATVKDGNNHITTLGSWYRGIPRIITYADTRSQSAVVNPSGWITQVTDENEVATHYTHDAMGRLASIIYPTGDTTVWHTTTQVFEPVAATEYGIGAGHWRQTISTGNARKIAYFDALWRPLVTQEYDAANVAGTQRFSRFAYDHEGRTTFASYPGTTDALTTGIWTEYDALGRVASVSQDSEGTPLTTLTQYLPGFQTRVTNPRNQVTLTGYQVFDQPSYDAPVWIQHPENARTDIARDVFGKPTSLTRRDAGNTQLVTRSYSYDGYQQLCKAVEPETGATLMGYDNAGNLAWSSAGLPVNAICEAGGTTSTVAARKASRTYDARHPSRR